ncbi:hypothetical protein [Bacillus sp. SD088]|uniref:hypothetical protein n=1 Tax=Bacillus sp. SD088 TaxID=2782012 RepID=UPI001A971362|nr:hypothetical protein [Bacillus sp. SD088]MBO0993882.1 hypothetical protein [Bacillus sp. SD088]
MGIIINEIKKILNWKILLVLAFVNVSLYYFLIEFDIQYFPNGRPALDSYRIGVEMLENYGPEMNETELADFKEKYKQEVQKADQFLQSRQDAQDVGVTSYEDFRNLGIDDQLADELHSKIMFEESVNLFWELQERERLIEFHDMRDEIIQNNPQQRRHLTKLMEIGHYDLYPEVVVMNYQSIIRSIAIAVLISVVLLVSPLLLRDRSLRILDLQYTAKLGRAIFKKKLVAGFISAFLVMSGLLAMYLGLYSQNHPEPFFDVPMNSFIGGEQWYDLTFFQYIILTVVAIYVLGFILVFMSLAVSHLVPNYITLIGVQVPIIFGLLVFGLRYLLDLITNLDLPQWLVPLCYSFFLVASIVFIMLLWKREKKTDIIL